MSEPIKDIETRSNEIRIKAIWSDARRNYTVAHRGYEISIPSPIFTADEMFALFNDFISRVEAKLGANN